jgi:CheY-like chemotaxis protein
LDVGAINLLENRIEYGTATMARTLVIEDTLAEQDRIIRYLQSRGVSADVAVDPMTAIFKLAGEQYDYVILDLDLGAGISDGEGILAWMDRHEKRIPTLVLSEAAALPAVIRLEKAFLFVVARMTHGDLSHLGDVVDRYLLAKPLPSTKIRSEEARPASTLAVIMTLVGALALLLVMLSVIKRTVPGAGFAQVVTASGLSFVLVAVVALFVIGRITEKGFVGLLTELLKKFTI